MSMYFVGDDPLLIPILLETYRTSEWFRNFVHKNKITVVVPKIIFPQNWIDVQGKHSSEKKESFDGYLYLDGKKYPLPFQKRRLFEFSNTKLRDLLRDYYISKMRVSTTNITGGGGEERTYKDWIIQQYGEELYLYLFQPFIENRLMSFAHQHKISDIGSFLSAGQARDWHIEQQNNTWTSYSFDMTSIHPNILIKEVGTFQSLQRNSESSWILRSQTEQILIETNIEQFYWACTPQQTFALLENSLRTTSLQVDIDHLQCQSIQRTCFYVNQIDKQVIWGIDRGVPHQILTDSHIMQVAYQSCGEETMDHDRIRGQLQNIGIPLGPPMFNLSWQVPVWSQQSHFRFRRYVDFLDNWNIKLLGNYGLFGHLSLQDLISCFVESQNQSNAEIVRRYVEPIVRSSARDIELKNIIYQF